MTKEKKDKVQLEQEKFVKVLKKRMLFSAIAPTCSGCKLNVEGNCEFYKQMQVLFPVDKSSSCPNWIRRPKPRTPKVENVENVEVAKSQPNVVPGKPTAKKTKKTVKK